MLTSENKSKLKNLLDELIELNHIWELLSDQAINFGVDMFDSRVLDKYVPAKFTDDINSIVEYLSEKYYEDAISRIDDIANHYIDLPWFDDDAEEYMFTGITYMLRGVAIQLSDKNK